jgi:outer membrane protein
MKFQKIALLSLTLFTISLFSQTEKGKFFIGAETNSLFGSSSAFFKIGDSDEKSNKLKNTNFSIAPSFGYFFANDFFIGIKGNITYNKSSIEDSVSKSTLISIGPNFRYYFPVESFKPFLNAAYSFNMNSFDSQGARNNSENKINLRSLELGGGLAFIINKNITLDLGLNYIRSSQEIDADVEVKRINNQFLASIGFAIFL